jgi:hypothetical protein
MGATPDNAGRLPAKAPEATIALPGAITTTGLELREGLAPDQWQQVGTTLAAIGRAHQWWLGDWLNYGERAYGETYTEAVKATGLDPGTLSDIAGVARRIEMPRRRGNLSFAHHREVSKLPPSEQDRWLAHAEQQGWTRNELRDELQALTGPPSPPEIGAAVDGDAPKSKPEREKPQGARWERLAAKTSDAMRRLEHPEQLFCFDRIRTELVEQLVLEGYNREHITATLGVKDDDFPPERVPEQLRLDGGAP